MPRHTILADMRRHAESQGDTTAYTYLKSDQERVSITYGELDERAQDIARRMLDSAKKGDRALLMYQPGIEFVEAFLGCLYAGIIAAPAYPPRKNRNFDRLVAIGENCKPKLLLCSDYTRRNVEGDFAAALPGSEVIVTDRIEQQADWRLPEVAATDMAFLQYTSGSTAAPKGVIVTHENIVANEESIKRAFRHGPESIVCGWLPLFHDMGLIGNVLQPLYIGRPCIFMSPISFLSQPIRWLRAISEFKATTSGGPNFAYEHCVKMISEEQCAELDLSNWSLAFNGSEPVQERTMRKFAEKFAPFGFDARAFFPCYGLAEATLYVSGGLFDPVSADAASENKKAAADHNEDEPLSVTSCGVAAENVEVRIVDPETNELQPAGAIGEIWMRGSSISTGYWGNPALTEETFGATIQNGSSDGKAYFRSGDLGFVRDDELYVTGRLKDLIIIRGRNIYPQDIEAAVERVASQAAANSVAAFAIEVDDAEQIAVLMEGSRLHVRLAKAYESGSIETDEELQAAAEEHASQLTAMRKVILAEFDLRVDHFAYVPPGQFPRTSSGKVQRQVCKRSLENESLPFLVLPGCVVSAKPVNVS